MLLKKDYINLTADELDMLNAEGINHSLAKILDENLELFYETAKYSVIFQEKGLIESLTELKNDVEKLKKEDKVRRSFETINLSEINDEDKEIIRKAIRVKASKQSVTVTITTFYEFFKLAKKINLKEVFESKDKDVKIRVKNILHKELSLAAIDIVKVVFEENNNYCAMLQLAELTGYEILEGKIIEKSKETVVNNKVLFNGFVKNHDGLRKDYLDAVKQTYQGFCDMALYNLSPITSRTNASIFFFSNRHLADYLGISKNKANYCLNYLASLGLIIKVDIKDVPEKLIENAEKYKEKIKDGSISDMNLITFFAWENLNNKDVLDEAIRRLDLLVAKKIAPYKLEMKLVKSTLGKDVYDVVYANTCQNARKQVKNRLKNQIFNNNKKYYYFNKFFNV